MRWLFRFVDPGETDPRRVALLRRAVGLFGLALVGLTWQLWTPQHVFPQVPLLAAAGKLPAWFDGLGCVALVAGLAGALLAPPGRWAKAALWLVAGSFVALALLDNQRLQPWAYQFFLLAVVLASAGPRAALVLLRLLVVSFYFHSAITKLDYAFLHTLGQQFLAALLGMVGLSTEDWGEPVRLAGAAVFPLGELLVAIGLFLPATRRVALALAIALHVLLLVILGPWGLDHKSGVLAWNAYFIVQDLLLFGGRAATAAAPDEPPMLGLRLPGPATALVVAAIVLPFFEPLGWFDLWPSWGLYAGSAERVILQVHRRDEGRLPDELRPFVETPDDANDPWLTLRLDRWALEALAAPIYPQNRVQLGVARGVAVRYGLGNRVRAICLGQAARFSGQREYAVFEGVVALDAAGQEYWFNTRPRANLE